MPVYLNPYWRTPSDFRINRGTLELFGYSWLTGVMLESGRYTVIEENVFGGYRTHIRYKPEFWEWGSGLWKFSEIFEDFYITEPGSTTPIPPGTTTGLSCGWLPPFPHQIVFLDQFYLTTAQFWIWQAPPPPQQFWSNNRIPLPALPLTYTI